MLAELYFEYEPEKDPTGENGRKIVELVFAHCYYNLSKFHEWVDLKGRLMHLEEEVVESRKEPVFAE